MRVHTPIAMLLEASGVGLERFASLARNGHLDHGHKPIWATEYARKGLLPDDHPEITGAVTWRRASGMWSLDIQYADLTMNVQYWGMQKGDRAQVRFEGATLPETLAAAAIGRPICDIAEHPFLGDPAMIVRSVRSYPSREWNGKRMPGSIEIVFDVPLLVIPDPMPDH